MSLSFVERLRRDVFLADELRIGRGHLHGEVFHQLLEIVGAGHEVGLAVDLDQHAELRAGVNVAADHALPVARAAFFAADVMPRLRRMISASAGCPWLPPERSCTPSCPRRYGRGALSLASR